MPEYCWGGYDGMSEKPRSRVSNASPSLRVRSAMSQSSAPLRPSSSTVSASKPASRSNTAYSPGRFWSILNFKR